MKNTLILTKHTLHSNMKTGDIIVRIDPLSTYDQRNFGHYMIQYEKYKIYSISKTSGWDANQFITLKEHIRKIRENKLERVIKIITKNE